ncbi:hypothetical protein O0L34_g19080 [Tuta absoluta]|nr:hypothetical protein O0L34_g19080 [Tuta absoluta]
MVHHTIASDSGTLARTIQEELNPSLQQTISSSHEETNVEEPTENQPLCEKSLFETSREHSTISSPTTCENSIQIDHVTNRRPIQINIPTYNSFNTLPTDEDDDPVSQLTLLRSCPELSVPEVQELKQEISSLKSELASTENEYENALIENNELKRDRCTLTRENKLLKNFCISPNQTRRDSLLHLTVDPSPPP